MTETVDDPVAYSLSKNLHRRHLTESQRGMVAAKIANMKSGTRTDKEPRPNSVEVKKSNTDAAQLLSVGKGTVIAAKKVHTKGDPELVEAVNRGEVKVSKAAKLADLPKEEQRAAIKRQICLLESTNKEPRPNLPHPKPL